MHCRASRNASYLFFGDDARFAWLRDRERASIPGRNSPERAGRRVRVGG
jgi:hypothetical protein